MILIRPWANVSFEIREWNRDAQRCFGKTSGKGYGWLEGEGVQYNPNGPYVVEVVHDIDERGGENSVNRSVLQIYQHAHIKLDDEERVDCPTVLVPIYRANPSG